MSEPLRRKRVVSATLERVFDAWTVPELMRRWLFASDHGELVHVESHPIVGGEYSILECNDGVEIDHFGTYLVVDRPHHLTFTLDVPEHFSESTQVDIVFTPDHGECIVEFTQTGIDPDKTRSFWETLLGQLARALIEPPSRVNPPV